MSAEHSCADDGADAPSLIELGEPLPSSIKQLGLSLSNKRAAATTSTLARSAPASASFRVRAMHLDDAAEDIILVCEDSITLFVPLMWSAAAAVAPSELERSPQCEKNSVAAAHDGSIRPAEASSSAASAKHHHGCSTHARGAPLCSPSRPSPSVPQPCAPTTNGAAAAACLRMGNPLQVWTSPLSTPCCTTASTSGLCLPRRLPMPREEVRCSASALIAVPVAPLVTPPLSASSFSRTGATGLTSEASVTSDDGACTAPTAATAVYIMECPVLPEGVDCIDASAVPLARPLAKIVCAPNTLRFREAWYPVRFFCWCDNTAAAATAATAASTATVSPPYADHHLLCVSSIAVDLIRVRHQVSDALTTQPPLLPPAPEELSPALSYGTGDTCGEGRIDGETPSISSLSPAHAATALSLTSSSFTTPSTIRGDVNDGAAAVSISVLQRYVTRSDWCTYDAGSRVLLSLNHARPSVVKPIKVLMRRRASSLDEEPSSKRCGEAEASSSPLELRTCTELTLSESLCATLHIKGTPRSGDAPGAASAALSELPQTLLQSPQLSHRLSSVLGVLTAYGQFWVYHVPSGCGAAGDRHDPVMNLYMYLPTNGHGDGLSSGASPVEGELGRGATGSGAAAEAADALDSDSLFRRLAAAASWATASAPLPEVYGGTFIHAARLSLAAVVSPAPRASRAAVQDVVPDAVEACEPALLLPKKPSLVALCVQVMDNLIVIHAPDTARSAVYDLADSDCSTVPQINSTKPSCVFSHCKAARCCVWRAAAPGAVGAGLQAHNPSAVSAATSTAALRHCSSEPTISPGAVGGTTPVSRGMGIRGYGPFQLSQLHHSDSSGTTDTVDGASAVVSRASLFSQPTVTYPPPAASSAAQVTTTSASATGHHQQQQQRRRLRHRKAESQRQVPSADFASLLSVLTSSILGFKARDPTSTTAATVAHAAPLTYPLYCCAAVAVAVAGEEGDASESEDERSGSKPVNYGEHQWLGGSRIPLVTNARDGTLRVCRVDAVRLAEWRLLVDASRVMDRVDQDPWLRQRGHALDADILKSNPLCGLVCSYVSFLCRRRQRFSAGSINGRSAGSVCALVGLLRELTSQVVGLSGTDGSGNAAAPLHADHAECAGVDVLRRLLLSAPVATLGAAGQQLCDLWTCVLANLTIEIEFAACCDEAARRNALALAGASGRADAACATDTEVSDRLTISSTELQQLLLRNVFAPTWTALQSSYLPHHPEYWQQSPRRRRLEGLLCDYVRLLRRAAISVEPRIQHLLLEVVLCDVSDASASLLGSPQATPVSRAAHRVQELLRQRVLEPNDATARRLLGWWGASQQARTLTRGIEADGASARRLHARGSSAEHLTDSSGAVNCAPSAPATAAPTPQRSAKVLPALFSPGDDMAEAETIFGEAMRLLESNGCYMEVAEAYSRRSHLTAAAAMLQRVPPQRKCAEVPADAPWPALSPHPTTRVLSWDSLALSVLDGAWRRLCCAEDDKKKALSPHTAGAPAASEWPRTLSDAASAPPKPGEVRSLERQVHAAHRTYITVATALLVKPAAGALPRRPASEPAHPSQGPLFAETLADVDRRFHAHQMHYEQLCRQMQQDWQELKRRGGA
ncbi:hypothetical protein LSCM1_05524 [Leishmania martiniquensis]|uniref:Uncharacterized protein n=1 Tax=Leishmania martiniquensis TaxID=1580590 RepID=A0A836KP16_9TRYP|nr:hypothetical protein LSCM1_05524 [Leishmania martiniquensis]